ncbi:MAG TPA: SWIM zinc finger family protein, partial [Thermoanaerobaculia bacterium]|nr:SWIM zinc finger family protein [Thermoanaerobaculia bacterium]
MSLPQELARFVSAGVRQRGQEYFRRRRVAIGDCGPLAANALVDGSQIYAVDLNRKASQILGSCSCPYAADRGEPCKHLWATLLAVDAQGGLRGDGSPPRRLVLAKDADTVEPGVLAPAGTAQAVLGPATPAWRAVLAKVAPAAPAVPPPAVGEIVYVIDAPGTLESGKLTLEVVTSTRKADGSPGALRPPRITSSQLAHLPDPADSRILSLLTGVTVHGAWISPHLDIATRFVVQEPASSVIVPLLCATGRCQLRRAAGALAEPLAWDDGAPWDLGLEMREERDGDLALTGSLRRGKERLDLAKPVLVLPSGLVFRARQVGRHSAVDS